MALVENKKVYFDYEITDTIEAGIELLGSEAKSLKAHQASLEGARVIIRGGEAYLIGMHIAPYQANNIKKDYDPDRNRRLLLGKKEIISLALEEKSAHLTIIPISCYNKGTKIKVSLGLGRSKKKHDKRQTLKRRDDEREMSRVKKGLRE